MKLHIKSIIGMAVEQGLIAGYEAITSDKFKGDADAAVDTLFTSVWRHLDEVIDLGDNSDQPKQKPKIGFTSAVAAPRQMVPNEEDPEQGDEAEQEESDSSHKRSGTKRYFHLGH